MRAHIREVDGRRAGVGKRRGEADRTRGGGQMGYEVAEVGQRTRAKGRGVAYSKTD